MVITASHSRTYRSSSAALAAISALVAAGISAMTSNSPVRWPTLTIRASAASFIVWSIRLAKSVASPAPASAIRPSYQAKAGRAGPRGPCQASAYM